MLSNLVLSCGCCNSNEKLAQSWEEFLQGKVKDTEVQRLRRENILKWQELNASVVSAQSEQSLSQANAMADEVVAFLDQRVKALVKLLTNSNPSVKVQITSDACFLTVPVTRDAVAQKISDYLNGEMPLESLVYWAEEAMLHGEIAGEEVSKTVDVISKLGLADVDGFGLTWDECRKQLGELGFTVKVSVNLK